MDKELKLKCGNFIRDNYHNMTAREIASKLGVKTNYIVMCIKDLGIRKPLPNYTEWKDSEITFLEENHKHLKISNLLRRVNKSKGQVYDKLKELGLTPPKRASTWVRWSSEEDECVLKLYKELGALRLAKQLNRDMDCVYSRAMYLGITKKTIIKEWSENEIDFVMKLYDIIPIHDLSKFTGRSCQSIRNKMIQMNIRKKKNIHKKSIGTVKKVHIMVCYQYISNHKMKDISENNKVSESTIMRILKKYKIQLKKGDKFSLEQKKLAIILYNKGNLLSDIMNFTGIKSEKTIYNILNEFEIPKRKTLMNR